jgi:hypothetical protein
MRPQPYPGYDVLSKWNTASFDDTTRRVLGARLRNVPPRRYLSEDEWALLDAIVARLVPNASKACIAITPWVDDMLEANRGEGFRYADMPSLRETWRLGLAGVDQEALIVHERHFVALDALDRDEILRAVQQDRVSAHEWQAMPASRFFVHVLLKTVAGIYYAHPAAWSAIGFGGPASPRGYVRLGFDERDPWEPREARTASARKVAAFP